MSKMSSYQDRKLYKTKHVKIKKKIEEKNASDSYDTILFIDLLSNVIVWSVMIENIFSLYTHIFFPCDFLFN